MSDFKLHHLITTGASEAEMIEAVLNDNQIEVIVRHDEFGGYSMLYMGFSAYNIELYVAEEDYEKAKELLNDLNIDITKDSKKVEQNTKNEKHKNNKKTIVYSLNGFTASIKPYLDELGW